MTRLIQLHHPTHNRRVALVADDSLHLLSTHRSIFELAQAAIDAGLSAVSAAQNDASDRKLDYDSIYSGESEWRILAAFDHPSEPARCLVSGTGLTHKASAENRQAMHKDTGTITDSMRMYESGLEGGRPEPGKIGVMPEWFYKGLGTILRGHGDPLAVPAYAEDGGEEPEIAGAYIIDSSGAPRRVGMMAGNEFSDHKTERKNYLYLAPSKLRTCAIGPEIVLDASFQAVPGLVRVERAGKDIWSKGIVSGEEKMSHTLANLEHHHFKYEAHRRPGDAHVHFFGADAFSFGEGVTLQDGDQMIVEFAGFGRALRNPIRIDPRGETLIGVKPV
jgi:hypothetical protein